MSRNPTIETRKSEREIFTAAFECTDPERRRRLLDAECGADSERRARLEALLEESLDLDGFLEHPAVPETLADATRHSARTLEPHAGEYLGDRIGPYQLSDLIGEGGGGSVYLAEQAAPVQRTVALKILKMGMDTKSVIARFEAERQALARMDHPNIARVLDAGATMEGRPYFVMDYVPGAHITDYCDANTLPIAERIGIFIDVCRAVEHAHQKGIIHRDLKPSNILVAEQDGAAVPKIIDFGVAKAIDPALAGRADLTHIETIIGTPAYMSPEQAERDLDIDTRCDVYSLGVLLHELLTSYTPLDGRKMARANIDEVRRSLRDATPVRPSVRLRETPAEDRPMIEFDRRTTLDKLISNLQGDLDWIVLKCLEPDRARRFGSASELARDLVRYLDGEPVTARPPSATYRLGKFVRRHRAMVAVCGVGLLLLVGAEDVSTALAIRAARAEHNMSDAHRGQSELRALAVLDREGALGSAGTARLHEYVADISVSYHALADGHIAKALHLLERQAVATPGG
jgi:serine/threonine protein kinase